jgi:hypothetical protein
LRRRAERTDVAFDAALASGSRGRVGHENESSSPAAAAHAPTSSVRAGHFCHIRDKPIPIACGDSYVETLDDILREHPCVVGCCVATVCLPFAPLRVSRAGRSEPETHEHTRDC